LTESNRGHAVLYGHGVETSSSSSSATSAATSASSTVTATASSLDVVSDSECLLFLSHCNLDRTAPPAFPVAVSPTVEAVSLEVSLLARSFLLVLTLTAKRGTRLATKCAVRLTATVCIAGLAAAVHTARLAAAVHVVGLAELHFLHVGVATIAEHRRARKTEGLARFVVLRGFPADDLLAYCTKRRRWV